MKVQNPCESKIDQFIKEKLFTYFDSKFMLRYTNKICSFFFQFASRGIESSHIVVQNVSLISLQKEVNVSELAS